MIRMFMHSFCIFFLLVPITIQSKEIDNQDVVIYAAKEWLNLIDLEKYSQSWEEASDFITGPTSEDKWIESLKRNRTPLGKMLSRKVKGIIYYKSFPIVFGVNYYKFMFESSFINCRVFEPFTLINCYICGKRRKNQIDKRKGCNKK